MGTAPRNRRVRRVVVVLLAVLAGLALLAGFLVWRRASGRMFTGRQTLQQLPVTATPVPAFSATPTCTPVQTVLPTGHAAPTEAPSPTPSPSPVDPSWVSFDGAYWKPKTSMVSVLFYGIDTRNREIHENFNLNSYQADVIFLCVVDTESGQVRLIAIPRDTIVSVRVLDMFFRDSCTEQAPIAVQHAYGDGGQRSAQLMLDAVGNLLNIPIDRYVSMDIAGIAAAVNAIGGVPITFTEDYKEIRASYVKGATVTLNGSRATRFVTARMHVGDGLNASRMARQKVFVRAFIAAARAKVQKNTLTLLTLYTKLSKHLLTNLTVDELLYLAELGLAADFSDASYETLSVTDASTADITLVTPNTEEIRAQMIRLYYEPTEG